MASPKVKLTLILFLAIMKSQTKVGDEDGYIKLNDGASVTTISQYTDADLL